MSAAAPAASVARLLALAPLLLAMAAACTSPRGHDAPASAQPRVVVENSTGAQHAVRVELARTEAERARGLMFRTSLDPDAGMLFVFEESANHGFWMQNTYIPLDMIFIDEAGRIVGIVENATPRSLEIREVGVPSRYVLEVNGGWSAAHGVRTGDRVRFENVMF
jgi:uncharacterized membrane protein (UPF0127 family)